MPPFDFEELPKKVALVHDWFSPRSVGGAEKVVKSIDSILTSIGRRPELACLVDGESSRKGSWLEGRSIQTSLIQRLPWGVTHVQQYLPLLPFAIEQLDLSDYPLVISSSHLVAKGILTSPEQLHLSYIHTPVRYAWDQMNIYLKRSSLSKYGLGPLIRSQLHNLRQWDQLSGARLNYILANSRFTSRRISQLWGRESKVVHPPVNVEDFSWDKKREEFYLCLCRLVPYKRVDIVIEAFNKLGLPLLVVGDGPDWPNLERLAGPNVQMLGPKQPIEVQSLMAQCRAFVYAGVEDFGIAPVEAMASGAPVIGLGKGGLLDTVRCVTVSEQSATGLLFAEQTPSSLIEAVSWFEGNRIWNQFSSEEIRLWAERFSPEAFGIRFKRALMDAYKEHKQICEVAVSDPSKFLELNP